MRRGHLRGEVLDDLAGDVRLREAAGDVDRAHDRVRLEQAEGLVHQNGVLVRRDAVIDDGPLADRLQEPGAEAASQEPVKQAKRGRGLAPVLPGSGEVELAHEAVGLSCGWWSSAR